MNKNLGTPIHESYLVPGQQYFLVIKGRGEGMVKLIADPELYELGPLETAVMIVDGGFNGREKRFRKGDVMPITPGFGKFYEVKL